MSLVHIDAVPIPTYHYGKSLYKPYVVAQLSLKSTDLSIEGAKTFPWFSTIQIHWNSNRKYIDSIRVDFPSSYVSLPECKSNEKKGL